MQSQTHSALEIIVVDDGSTDSTGFIVEEYASADPRIRLLSQRNGGVAAARNHGWRNARSDLIAFVDADDLWSPRKLERQLRTLEAGGDRVGLVYSWYAPIDDQSRVIETWPGALCQGQVLDDLFQNNFVGNGSSALFRREALVVANGFDSALRAAQAQGCEDYLIYCRIAEHYDFAVVPEHDIGYRYSRDNMSSNPSRMLLSWMLVMSELRLRHPTKEHLLAKGLRRYARRLTRQTLFARRPARLVPMFALLFRRYPIIGADMLFGVLPWTLTEAVMKKLRKAAARQAGGRSPSPPRFAIGDKVPAQAGPSVGSL